MTRKRDDRIDPATAPASQIRALPWLQTAVYLSTRPERTLSHRMQCHEAWTMAIERLRMMVPL